MFEEIILYAIVILLVGIGLHFAYKFFKSTGRIMTKKKRMEAKKAAAKAATAPKPADASKAAAPAIPLKYAEEETLATRGSASNLSDDILELYNKEKKPTEDQPRTRKESSRFGEARSERIEKKYKEIQEHYAKKFGSLAKTPELVEDIETGTSNLTGNLTKSGHKDIKNEIDIGSDNFKRIFVSDVLKKKPE